MLGDADLVLLGGVLVGHGETYRDAVREGAMKLDGWGGRQGAGGVRENSWRRGMRSALLESIPRMQA